MAERDTVPVNDDTPVRDDEDRAGPEAVGEGRAEPAAPGAAGPGAEPAAASGATVEALAAEVERARREAEANWQHFLRAAADLENYKKQAQRAREDAVERTRRAMLTVILSVVDNIERALAYGAPGDGGEGGAILEGIQMAHRQMLDLLQNMGVRPFESVGRSFDPRYHEAVEVVAPAEGHPAGAVVAEIQRGYLIGDEILRPARVRVAQPQ